MGISNNINTMPPSTQGLQKNLGQDIAFTSMEKTSSRKTASSLYAMKPNAYYDLGAEMKQARAENGVGLNLDISI